MIIPDNMTETKSVMADEWLPFHVADHIFAIFNGKNGTHWFMLDFIFYFLNRTGIICGKFDSELNSNTEQ